MVGNRAVIVSATLAGSAVRITRAVFRYAFRALPGVLGAAAVTVGCGGVVQRVFGRGLGWPAGLVVAGLFVLWFGAELNRVPPAPPRDEQ